MGEAIPKELQNSLESTKVEYVQLGKSGLRVSLPILGAMSFGSKDWQPWVVDDEAEVDKLLLGAYERGLNTWDTANVYSNGVSEELIGRFIKKNNIPRHKLLILTKCFGTVGETPAISHMKYAPLSNVHEARLTAQIPAIEEHQRLHQSRRSV